MDGAEDPHDIRPVQKMNSVYATIPLGSEFFFTYKKDKFLVKPQNFFKKEKEDKLVLGQNPP